ncbi:exonuclease domain-containing protein [Domibacillus robiginosus]|uniref:exonuclease domain-containing protein n=1 Tax=Domibacillus robiginosus TaxID=1071054 RepID=UPI00067D561A|nr:exonuclease domain-containing protein [Domibacillus robiginosus]
MKNFTALDFETANASRSSVCSIGLAKVVDGKIQKTYYSLVNPNEYFDARNIAVHGIRPEEVKDAPSFSDIFNEVMTFIGDDPIVAHFAQFDINVLRSTAKKHGLSLPNSPYFCSCMLAKSVLQLPSYKLNVVAGHFNFTFNHHNALEDAIACAVVVNGMMKSHASLTAFLEKAEYGFGYLHGDSFRKKKPVRPQSRKPKPASSTHPFFGKSISFTGTLTSMKREEAINIVESFGANVHPAVKKNTDYLIVGETDAKKYRNGSLSRQIQAAKDWQARGGTVKLVSEQKFFDVIRL